MEHVKGGTLRRNGWSPQHNTIKNFG